MRQSRLIVIAAVTAILVAWLLLTQLPSSPPAPVHKTPAYSPVAPQPVQPAAAPSEGGGPPTQEAVPAAESASSAEQKTEAQSAAPSEPAAKADESASGNESAETASDENAEDSAPAEDDAHSSGLDVNRAADLLADWMARQDTASGDDAEIPKTVQALRTFDQEAGDSDWSGPTAQQIEASLDAWLDGLPDDVRDHVDLIHVECRQSLCQILAADDDMAGQTARAQSSQEWQQAITTLPQQPWWTELGFVDLVTAVDNDEASGYVLYQTYLRREAKPPQ
jgi:hypothetical protein